VVIFNKLRALFGVTETNTLKTKNSVSISKLHETWNYNLMDMLKQARLGRPKEMRDFLMQFAPFAAVNDDFTILLILRTFQVSMLGNKRKILNGYPIDEKFQWGITIVKSSANGGAEHNVYIPNEKKYLGIKIEADRIEIITDDSAVRTNEAELTRKLFFLYDESSYRIATAFEELNNEHYPEKPKHDFTGSRTIKIPSIGELIYDERFDRYEGKFTDNYTIEVNIHHTTPKELQKVMEFADSQLRSKFYNQMLIEMEGEMIEQKNGAWLDDDIDERITVEEFRKRITIESIVFYDNCSTQIYCSDDNLFFGHSIQIEVDENGKYIAASLVG
jgi:hypothetical protein